MSVVTSIIDRQRAGAKRPAADEAALKRIAMQIVIQLPEDTGEAIDVLKYAESLVRSYLEEPRPA